MRTLKLFILSFFVCGLVLASPVEKTIIDSKTINDVSGGSTSDTVKLNEFERATFVVDYDETETGGGLSADVTAEMSFDGTTWVAASFLDVSGGLTPQTTENISADGSYIFWVDNKLGVPFYRVVVTGTGEDSDDTIAIDASFSGIK